VAEPVPSSMRTLPSAPERRGYFDLLRGLALLRVVVYHTVAVWWLHVVFPAIGVMFALAGSLMPPSMRRRSALRVVGSRLRRLLPPVWLYAAVALICGWEVLGPGGHDWSRLLFWVVPLRDPHETSGGSGFVDTLWYLRTYLWFVLLTPPLLWAFRKASAIALAAPLVLLPAAAFFAGNGTGRGLVISTLSYGTCWMLGFAEHDGVLRRISFWVCGLVALIVGGAGMAVLLGFPIADPKNAGLDEVGYALWSAAVVLVLMRWRPDTSWLRRVPGLDRMVTVVNARAVTIYLWHDAAIVATGAIVGLVGLHLTPTAKLPMVFALVAVAVLLAGWMEDLAARRRPSLLPGRRPSRAGPQPAVRA